MKVEVTSSEPQVAKLVAVHLKTQAEALKVRAEINAGRMKNVQVVNLGNLPERITQLPEFSNHNGIYTK